MFSVSVGMGDVQKLSTAPDDVVSWGAGGGTTSLEVLVLLMKRRKVLWSCRLNTFKSCHFSCLGNCIWRRANEYKGCKAKH